MNVKVVVAVCQCSMKLLENAVRTTYSCSKQKPKSSSDCKNLCTYLKPGCPTAGCAGMWVAMGSGGVTVQEKNGCGQWMWWDGLMAGLGDLRVFSNMNESMSGGWDSLSRCHLQSGGFPWVAYGALSLESDKTRKGSACSFRPMRCLLSGPAPGGDAVNAVPSKGEPQGESGAAGSAAAKARVAGDNFKKSACKRLLKLQRVGDLVRMRSQGCGHPLQHP